MAEALGEAPRGTLRPGQGAAGVTAAVRGCQGLSGRGHPLSWHFVPCGHSPPTYVCDARKRLDFLVRIQVLHHGPHLTLGQVHSHVDLSAPQFCHL